MVMSVMLLAVSTATSPALSHTDALIECYADQTTKLRRSAEPVETVADAVMTLCVKFEAAANEELYQSSVRSVQENTGGSLSEATRAASSVRDQGWRQWKANIRGNIVAALVQTRLGIAPHE